MKRFVTRALIVVAAILGIVFAQVAPASANELTAAGLPPNWHIHDGQLALGPISLSLLLDATANSSSIQDDSITQGFA
jgi:hypothetical protein